MHAHLLDRATRAVMAACLPRVFLPAHGVFSPEEMQPCFRGPWQLEGTGRRLMLIFTRQKYSRHAFEDRAWAVAVYGGCDILVAQKEAKPSRMLPGV